MKHLSLFLATALLISFGSTAGAQSLKLGKVDLKKVFDGYWKTKQADINLKARARELEDRRSEMVVDVKKANEDYKKLLDAANNKAVSLTERDKRKADAEAKLREIREIEESLRQFDRSARVQIGEQQRNMRDKIIVEIREAINGFAKADSYACILDSSAPLPPAPGVNTTPFLLYSAGLDDITEKIITQLNAGAPAAVLDKAK